LVFLDDVVTDNGNVFDKWRRDNVVLPIAVSDGSIAESATDEPSGPYHTHPFGQFVSAPAI
jgi:hypothetical protein